MKQRVQAFRPGGSEARRLARMPVAIQVLLYMCHPCSIPLCVCPSHKRLARMPVPIQIGDTILVHGGLRSKHLKYGMQCMNNKMAAWLEGLTKYNVDKLQVIDEPDSPIRVLKSL